MPKRPNPWMDDAPFLLKTHISTKELSAGVDGENYASMMLGEFLLFFIADVLSTVFTINLISCLASVFKDFSSC